MFIDCLADLSLHVRVVAEKIISVVVDRYPPDVYEFRHLDLFDYQASIRRDCQSAARDMRVSIRQCVYALRDNNLLENVPGERGVFRLLPDQNLYLHVKRKRLENMLAHYTR